jgi:hypothetical protein
LKNAPTETLTAKRWIGLFIAFAILLSIVLHFLLMASSTLHGLLSPIACNAGETLEWSASGTGNSVDYAYCCIGPTRGCIWTQEGVLDEGPGVNVLLTCLAMGVPLSLLALFAVPRRYLRMVR